MLSGIPPTLPWALTVARIGRPHPGQKDAASGILNSQCGHGLDRTCVCSIAGNISNKGTIDQVHWNQSSALTQDKAKSMFVQISMRVGGAESGGIDEHVLHGLRQRGRR